jgi:hypothetical protein
MSDLDFSSFLAKAGWGDASVTSMGADMGFRRYYDLEKPDGTKALLMDMSNVGYEESLDHFVKIADYLRKKGINAPEIYSFDSDKGLSVIENFGSTSFGDALHSGENKETLYSLASDILLKIRQTIKDNDLNLAGYKNSLVWKRLEQFVDFYCPAAGLINPAPEHHEELWGAMAEIESQLPDPLLGLCHADYHLENLMWCPDTPERYGLIDFQDAFWGPLSYDLLNLLEDARVTVPDNIKQDARKKYCEGMTASEKESFDAWYLYLSAHFHCRVIGLFVKFSKENNSTEFLQHIPRLQNYIKGHLKNPVMTPLKKFIENYDVSLDADLSDLLKTG